MNHHVESTRCFVGLLFGLVLAARPAEAQLAGTLDTSFGEEGTGKVITVAPGPYNEYAADAAITCQADGKILVVSGMQTDEGGNDFSLIRYNANGTLDTTFGNGGIVTTDFGSDNDWPTSVAIQADGRIVVAGTSWQAGTGADFAVARYLADGTLDTTFDDDGFDTIDLGLGNRDEARSVAVHADNRIVIAGHSYRGHPSAGGTREDFALVRCNEDGSLDTNFDEDGWITTALGSHIDQAYAVAIQADDRIVAAGVHLLAGDRWDFAVVRYTENGLLDPTFGGDGIVTTDFGLTFSEAYDVAIQRDGNIVAAGFSYQGDTGDDFALARYRPDGTLDESFGSGGLVLTDFGGYDWAYGVAIQADDRIVAAGYGDFASDTSQNFAMARYDAFGNLDPTFGDGGLATTDFGSNSDQAYSVAIQADGRIVAAGGSYQGETRWDIALARYHGVSEPDALTTVLIDEVESLVTDGAMNHGQGNALGRMLQGALQHIDAGHDAPAIKMLDAFINAVNASEAAGNLTSGEAGDLRDLALAAIIIIEVS